ncbi:MAG TPA: DNA repair protein RadC [Firmicutes bacterium]|jgi:DNA repair protein RadC|nr:DNA repair protein RadC [Bacillota bacterium]
MYLYRLPIYQVRLVRDGSQRSNLKKIVKPTDVTEILNAFLTGVDRENFVVIMLNTKNQIIGINTVAIGMLSSCPVHPREVFKPVILANAAGVILGHNHPSGEPSPSQDDLALTNRLRDAGELLGIPVIDHIIIGDEGRFYSFKEHSYF